MLPSVDYSDHLYTGYAQGRALTETATNVWRSAFGRNTPPERPLTVLDLGCGTGRFTPLLGDLFGGPVFGVEPSGRMRAIAQTENSHPAVTYLSGDAAKIPLDNGTCDVALLFLMFHHVPDKVAAANEIARVLRPGGLVLLQSSFAGQLEDRCWFRYFPRARSIEEEMFPVFEDVVDILEGAGLAFVRMDRVECEVSPSLAGYAHKLNHRAIPTFEYLTEDEISAGFRALDAAVSAEEEGHPEPVVEPAHLVVFEKRE